MNEQIHKNNSSTKEENQLKEMCTLDSFMIIYNKRGFCTSRIPTNGTSTCWMLEIATQKVTVRVVIWWVVDLNTES